MFSFLVLRMVESSKETLKKFECPICFELMIPPIYLCVKGHSFCNKCKTKITICAVCRSSISNARNYTLEDIMQQMKYPCQNRGCIYVCLLKDMKSHEDVCIFKKYTCPYDSGCSWNGRLSFMVDHLKASHMASLTNCENTGPLTLNRKTDYFNNFISQSYDSLFRVMFDQNATNWRICVQFIGSSNDASKYGYEVKFVAEDHAEYAAFMKKCQPYTNQNSTWIYLEVPLVLIKNLDLFVFHISLI